LIGWFGFLTASRTLITESVGTEARATAISGTDVFATLGSFIGNFAIGQMVMMNIKTDVAMTYLMPIMFVGLLLLTKIDETKPKIKTNFGD
jgi:MFS-type transporter involved in bile tolerance (Atg22 family)